MFRPRTLIPAFCAVAACGFPTQAFADIESDAINTKCSSDQIILALQKSSPVAWSLIGGDPTRVAETKAQLNNFLSLSPSGRKEQLNQTMSDGSPSPIKTITQYEAIAHQVFQTCNQY